MNIPDVVVGVYLLMPSDYLCATDCNVSYLMYLCVLYDGQNK